MSQGRQTEVTNWDALPVILTLEQVAAVLGVGRTAAYEAHRRGQLPGGFFVGRRLRFPREAIRRWAGGAAEIPKAEG